jgi:uncharacterized membrane protein YGL010W
MDLPLLAYLNNGDKTHTLERYLSYYSSQHRTFGCKVTHMFGVPMIAASVLLLPFNRKASGQMMLGGWILQFIGHFVFEHNTPVVLEVRDPKMLLAALIFVGQEWKRFLCGQRI